jgi:hypothetical protein
MIRSLIRSPIRSGIRSLIGVSTGSGGGGTPSPWLFPAGTVDFSVTVDFNKLVGVF